jgi:hypothetical protein
LKRNASDAIRAVIGQTTVGERIGGIELTERARLWLWQRAVAIAGCREVRAFREAQCGAYEVHPVSCKCRVCADCERARSARRMRAVSAIVEQVPAGSRSLLTLTIRNTVELRAGLAQLDRAFASLRRRPLFRGGRCRARRRDGRPMHPCAHPGHRRDRNCPGFRHRAVAGGGRFDEVTFNLAARTWHPHAHLLLEAPYLPQQELADTWRAVTCTDPRHRRAGWCPAECDEGSPVVDIRAVDAGTVREAVKYVTKVAELVQGDDPVQLVEFMLATRGRRMVRGFGSFYGLDLVEEELPEGETVTMFVDTGEHTAEGRPIVTGYKLPRWCRQCGRDTRTDDGCTYELPIVVPRVEVRLRNGSPTWRPPGRGV